MALPLRTPPKSLCLLRLSAVGDVSHVLPVVRTLQAEWPATRITWVIGRLEHSLVRDVPGVDFIIFDKARRWRAYADLHRALRGRRFDVLLHMQHSLRASLASLLIRADVRLGFDRARAKDLQWLFTNARIAPRPQEHVVDGFFGFAEALGVTRRELRWDIPIPEDAHRFAASALGHSRVLVISPCSSMSYRNWTAEGYAAVGDYAAERYGLRVVITGAPSTIERGYAEAIKKHMRQPPLDLVGQTDLKQLLAVLARAAAVVAPDSGPAHLATAVGTPVVGLYATTNPDRARPYLSGPYTVSRYDEAVKDKYGQPPEALPFGIRVRDAGTMERIKIADVTAAIDRLFEHHPERLHGSESP